MNSTRKNGEKTGYKVILLLVVGLTAFSSAMKELNQLQQFTREASRLIAQVSQKAPAPAQETAEIAHTALLVETCERKQSIPSVELPWLDGEPKPNPKLLNRQINVKKDVSGPRRAHIASLKKLPQIDIDPVQFEVRVPLDHDPEDGAITSELPVSTFSFKARSRRNGTIRINPRDHEMLLKMVNRSINLRIAG